MSQVIFDTIDPNVTSGTQLATLLNDFKDAVISSQSGAARPSEIDPGGQWLKIVSATVWEFYVFDGTDDILVYTVNPTANSIKFPGTTDEFSLSRQSADSIGPILEFLKKRDTGATQVNDELGVIEFRGFDGTTEYVQSRIRSLSLDITSATEQGANIIIETTSQDANALIEALRITGDGNVGIGNVSAPSKKLHVKSATSNAGAYIERNQDVAGGSEVAIKKIRSITDNGQTKSADQIGVYSFKGTDQNGADVDLAQIEVETTEDTTDTAQGSKLTIRTKSNGATAFTDNIVIENGIVSINGVEQNLDIKSSADLLDDTATRNLFSINGATYKAFTATVHAWGDETAGANKRAQVSVIEGIYDGATWYFTNDDKTLNANGLLLEFNYTNAETLVVDYVNQINNVDFNTGKIHLEIVRKK